MSDRFKLPCPEDDYRSCNGCGERKHYEALDDEGLCQECRPEEDEE